MNRTIFRSSASVAAAFALTLGLAACGASNENGSDGASDSNLSGTLNGAGSSAQEASISSIAAAFQTANPDVTVNYDPVGSGGGREQFIAGGTDFGGTDAFLDETELTAATERCGSDVIELPTYVSPIAVIFNLEGVTELNLSPETIGGIFAGDITKWNDPKIVADNADAKLPDADITPVHRADDSGTTDNFTEYLEKASGGAWTHGTVGEWPISSGEAGEGTSGVVSAVKGGTGTIGYADASQAGDLGVAKIKVGDEFVAYSPEAAGKALDVSKQIEGRGDNSVVFELDRTTTESGVYPLVLVSYQLACATYEDAATADLVKGFLTFAVSEEGQKASADGAGSAPISAELSEKLTGIAEKISAS